MSEKNETTIRVISDKKAGNSSTRPTKTNIKGKIITWLAIIAVMFLIISGVAISASNGKKQTPVKKINTSSEVTKKNGKETEKKTEAVAYSSKTVEDNTLEYGETKVRTKGVNGEKTITYEVEYKDDVEISRTKVSEEVTKKPVDEVIAKGTKIVWDCYDATSYDKNPYNDNKCVSSTGEVRYVSDSQSKSLDPSYSPGKSGHSYYNSK